MFYGDMAAVMIMMVGLRRMGAHTNGAGGLDDGGSADGGVAVTLDLLRGALTVSRQQDLYLKSWNLPGFHLLLVEALRAPSPLPHWRYISPKF